MTLYFAADIYLGIALNALWMFVLIYLLENHFKNSNFRLCIGIALMISNILVFTQSPSRLLFDARWMLGHQIFTINLLAPSCALAFYLLTPRLPKPMAWISVVAIFALASLGPLFYHPCPQKNPRHAWSGRVCLQSHPYTCSPAAAATLLKTVGIDVEEFEMISCCLTSKAGTAMQWLYRSIYLKAFPSGYLPKLLHLSPSAWSDIQTPMLINVQLKDPTKLRYIQDWGWKPGVVHSVVLYEVKTNGKIVMGDPAIGEEQWDLEALDVLWDGWGIILLKR